MSYEPNPLDRYTQYQPYFRLFMVPEAQAMQLVIPGKNAWSILAETGGSALTATSIENVEIVTYGGMDKDTGMGVASNFVIEMKQSSEAGTLLDAFYNEARKNSIKQVKTIPMFLELTFRVRDPASQDPLGWEPLRDYRRVWPIALTATQMQITSQGTEYRFEAAYFGGAGLSRELGQVRHNFKFRDVTTVGELFDKLAKYLTQPPNEKKRAEEKLYSRNIQYKFKYDPQIGEINLRPYHIKDSDTANSRSDVERSEDGNIEDGEIEYSFQVGHSIEQCVTDILMNTDYFQASICGNKSADETMNSKVCQDKEATKKKKMFRILQDVKLTGWNSQLQDYNKEVTYNVVEYVATTPVASATDPQVAPTTLADYGGRLRKRYDYMFTGLNDDVLDFQVVFNFHWYQALATQGGVYQQSQLGDLGAKDNVEDKENRRTELDGTMAPEPGMDVVDTPMNAHPSIDPVPMSVNGEVYRTRGRNLTSVLFEQAMSPTSGDMINVEMKIKGDPFWLEPDPMPNIAGQVPTYSERAGREPTPTANNTGYGQTYVLFVAYGGQPYDPGTGLPPTPGDKTIYSGVYSVVKAVHNFEGSKFTQTLSLVRDIRFSIKNIGS